MQIAIERIINKHLDNLNVYFSDCKNHEEALNELPFFSVRWLHCKYKLGKSDVDVALEFVEYIYGQYCYLGDEKAKKYVEKAIVVADEFVEKYNTSGILDMLDKIHE